MTVEYICKCAKACVRVYGTAEPEKIFALRGIPVKSSVLGGLKSMICIIGGKMFVYIDRNMKDSARRVALAHLAGHCFLHRDRLLSGESFEDTYTGSSGTAEREANIFAAELLISDSTITELCACGYTEGQLASALGGLRELVSYKIFSMRSRRIPVCGDISRVNFMNKCDVDIFS